MVWLSRANGQPRFRTLIIIIGVIRIKKTKHVESSKQNLTHASRKQSLSKLSKSTITDHTVQNNHIIDSDNANISGNLSFENLLRVPERSRHKCAG